MKSNKKAHNDPYAANKQLINACAWLRGIKYAKTYKDIAVLWGVSAGTMSAYLSKSRVLGDANAARFDKQVLRKHKLTLADFKTDLLIKQARAVAKPSQKDIASLLATQMVLLHATQELILDKLVELEKKIGELRGFVTKLR
jgi:hypothetical protein